MPGLARHRSPSRLFGFFFGALGAVACLDPLYEQGEELAGSWAVCCDQGQVDTCLCGPAQLCQAQFRACAFGQCAAPGSVCGGSGGGAGGGAGGGGGGPADAGLPWDAGSEDDAGVPDAGQSVVTGFEPCCVGGKVTTCGCPAGGCQNSPFRACPRGACVATGTNCPSG